MWHTFYPFDYLKNVLYHEWNKLLNYMMPHQLVMYYFSNVWWYIQPMVHTKPSLETSTYFTPRKQVVYVLFTNSSTKSVANFAISIISCYEILLNCTFLFINSNLLYRHIYKRICNSNVFILSVRLIAYRVESFICLKEKITGFSNVFFSWLNLCWWYITHLLYTINPMRHIKM